MESISTISQDYTNKTTQRKMEKEGIEDGSIIYVEQVGRRRKRGKKLGFREEGYKYLILNSTPRRFSSHSALHHAKIHNKVTINLQCQKVFFLNQLNYQNNCKSWLYISFIQKTTLIITICD